MRPAVLALRVLLLAAPLACAGARARPAELAAPAPAAAAPLPHRIALVGNPKSPNAPFDARELDALARLGFTEVQINVAWGSRPGDEPLNLEDVVTPDGEPEAPRVAERRREMQRRARAVKGRGLRVMFHFGAPRVPRLYKLLDDRPALEAALDAASIERAEIVARYRALLAKLAAAIPEVDDVLVYTFDQDAWIESEFGDTPRARGIPLHERLPRFLHALRDAWAALRPQGTLYWEPWELSAGQALRMVEALPRRNFGLCLHSNVAEVQATRPVDPWFRNMAREAGRLGIPVVAEIFLSSANEEVQPLQRVVAPRLVHEQIEAVRGVPGVVGIKEYYGLRPALGDPNLEMAGLALAAPGRPAGELVARLAAPYGPAAGDARAAWEATAEGLALFPWDSAWTLRDVGGRHPRPHGWEAFHVDGRVASSPSWKSTRRAIFMTTEREALHPWFFEDVGLRFGLAAARFAAALEAYERALAAASPDRRAELDAFRADVARLRAIARDRELHAAQTLVAHNLRRLRAREAPERLAALKRRLRALLEAEVENERRFPPGTRKGPSAAEQLRAFDAGPAAWVEANLLFGPGQLERD